MSRRWARRARETGLITVKMKKVLVISGIAVLVYFLVVQPQSLAGIVNILLDTLRDAAESLITFVQMVFSG
ncbi:MAG: hypothetical protein GEU98_20105 [Pseudonocardiaceae bacterium]|nr:hypothetical protein [Pseudonocardiaceae bacterium]